MAVDFFFTHVHIELIGNFIHNEESFYLFFGLLFTAGLKLLNLLADLLAGQSPHEQVRILSLQYAVRLLGHNIQRQV